MKELEALAETVKDQLGLEYDAQSVKFIEEFIERQKTNFSGEERQGLINSLGSFLGKCIIVNYGGKWEMDEQTNSVCVAFDEQNRMFPFAKTAKQFENGTEDSVYTFYMAIPAIFKLNPKDIAENTEKSGQEKTSRKTDRWWKFW